MEESSCSADGSNLSGRNVDAIHCIQLRIAVTNSDDICTKHPFSNTPCCILFVFRQGVRHPLNGRYPSPLPP